MIEIVRLPYLGTAEEDVLFVEWFLPAGEPVRKGQSIAVVETLKASFEVEADQDGVLLHHLVEAGERVPLQAAVGVIGPAGEELTDERLAELLADLPETIESSEAEADALQPTAKTSPPASRGTRTPVAPAARRRAAELGVDVERVTGTGRDGLVRVVDVERAHAEGTSASKEADGTLDPEFLTQLREDPEAFASLASDEKVSLYRRHGARIGADCRIGPGTVLRAERLVLGDGAFFGRDCSLEARDFEAGTLLHFGQRCSIRCTRVAIGDNAFFTDDIEIGGGGAMDPEAELIVGSHGFVGEHVHLNPCRTLRLGDEVVVSRNAVVMTHSFGGSILAGYPNRFAGVTIGDGAQLGIAAVLFPGVEVGAGAILMSGSSLVSSMPPGRLFGGVPAVDLKAAARPLTPAEFTQIARELVEEFARQMQLRGMAVRVAAGDAETRVTIEHEGHLHRLRFADGRFVDDPADLTEEVRVGTRFDADSWEALPQDVAGIDLSVPAFRGPAGPLADAFREFLRKRGVRLRPRAWTYRGGWL